MQKCHTMDEYSELLSQAYEYNGYQEVDIADEEWEFLSDNESAENLKQYLPKPNEVKVTTGIKEHKTLSLNNFDSMSMSETLQGRRGHIVNTGQSIWGLDFVPQHSQQEAGPKKRKRRKLSTTTPESLLEYIAVGGYNTTTEHHSLDEERDADNCCNAIQIYELKSSEIPKQDTTITLSMCIIHNFGVVVDLKWCPFSVFKVDRKLGILTLLFSEGSSIVLVIPSPAYVRNKLNLDKKNVVYIRVVKPRLSLTLDNSLKGFRKAEKKNKYTCFSWGGDKIAYGTMRGDIVIWNMLASLRQNIPSLHIMIPSTFRLPTRCISWRSHFDPFSLCWTDLDGNIVLQDLRDPYVPYQVFRTRQPYVRITCPGHGTGFLYADTDNVTRKNLCFNMKKGAAVTTSHALVWDIAVSPYHNVAVTVSANGLALAKAFKKKDQEYSNGNHRWIPQYTLYRLTFDAKTSTYRYIDYVKLAGDTSGRDFQNIHMNPEVALQKAAWNPNKKAAGWIATGGASGLCRIEYTGGNDIHESTNPLELFSQKDK